ncbi:MAG: mechanosensitive ion channel, partial [Proteobacteria bacterium]|nr:mechanosensitive ion channel [Pseudomonadota bacterium]
MRRFCRALAVVVLSLAGGAVATVHAQTPTAPPAGLSQAQYDSLVEAISESVAQKMKAGAAQPAAKPAKGAKPPSPEIVRMEPKAGPGEFAQFLHRAGTVMRTFPDLGRQFNRLLGSLEESSRSRGNLGFILLLGSVAAAAVAMEGVLRLMFRRLRTRLAAGAGPEQGVRSLVNLAGLLVLDGLGLLAVWVVCNVARVWFEGETVQDWLAEAILAGIFAWRLALLMFRFVLQPDAPSARLCAAESGSTRRMYSAVATVLLVLIVGRAVGQMLLDNGTPVEAMAAYQVGTMAIAVVVFLWLAVRARDAARQWLAGLGTTTPLAGFIGRHWTGLACTFFVMLALTQAYSAISGRIQVGGAMLLTLGLVVGLLFFETLVQAFVRRLDVQLPERSAGGAAPKLPDVVARCVRVAVLIGVLVAIAERWIVEVLALASPDQWDRITQSSRTAAASLFVAYVLWELFTYVTAPYMARPARGVPGGPDDGDSQAATASRLGTMMPLLRTAAAILIVFTAVVIALEDFGINVMPLIAGASIFGIAISFGSQTLVRDIVSGIFYLTDDAFRVGEYIDCGRAKGTVEGFTLRSIKLRHQNGQVHTIPFGQLGQITNFSRDWLTVKFNLRFALDTDIEKLR